MLQMIVEPREEEGSVFWKAVEQFYRFGVGSVAGGEFCFNSIKDVDNC